VNTRRIRSLELSEESVPRLVLRRADGSSPGLLADMIASGIVAQVGHRYPAVKVEHPTDERPRQPTPVLRWLTAHHFATLGAQ
jgi:hypothetical protein